MPELLNSSSVMMCPHGGTVQAISSNTRTQRRRQLCAASVGHVLLSPAARSQYHRLARRIPVCRYNGCSPPRAARVMGDFTLTEASVGLCIAADQGVQGTVLIVATQPRVSGV